MSYRNTKNRDAIQQLFSQNPQQLWSAKNVKEKLPQIDLVTIYRNLELFVKEHIIREVPVSQKESLFEYAHDQHHHVICDNCEKVEHIHLSSQAIRNIPELKHLDPSSVHITVRGVCKN